MATQLADAPDLGGGEVAALNVDTQSQPEERDFEAEARSHGWTPQEEFKGDPARWVDAETFIKRADEVMPLLKKQNAHQKRELEEMKRTIKRLSAAEQRAYENARADIAAEMEAAVEAGDLTAF
jgi:hypothetical protein